MDYIISIEENPKAEDLQIVQRGILDFNLEQGIEWDVQPFSIFLRNKDNTLGGISGVSFWGWLEIKYLWISEEIRNKGFGSKLLKSAEAEALKRNCHSVMVGTFSFQALKFYEKSGYEVYGRLDNFPVGHSRYFLKKSLKE